MVNRGQFARATTVTRRVMRGFAPETLAAARQAAKMSRGDLARLIGATPATVGNWETGRTKPQVDSLAQIARVLGQPISRLVQIDPTRRYLGDLRVLAGLMQPELAREAGISTAHLSALERGEVRLTSDVAQRLAGSLHVPVGSVEQAYALVRSRPAGDPP